MLIQSLTVLTTVHIPVHEGRYYFYNIHLFNLDNSVLASHHLQDVFYISLLSAVLQFESVYQYAPVWLKIYVFFKRIHIDYFGVWGNMYVGTDLHLLSYKVPYFFARWEEIGIFSKPHGHKLHENEMSLAALSDISRGYNLQIKLSNWKRDCSAVQQFIFMALQCLNSTSNFTKEEYT